MKRLAPDKTELVDVTLRVAMNPKVKELFDRDGIDGLLNFYWEVFCMRNPLGKWDQFQIVDVTKTEEASK